MPPPAPPPPRVHRASRAALRVPCFFRREFVGFIGDVPRGRASWTTRTIRTMPISAGSRYHDELIATAVRAAACPLCCRRPISGGPVGAGSDQRRPCAGPDARASPSAPGYQALHEALARERSLRGAVCLGDAALPHNTQCPVQRGPARPSAAQRGPPRVVGFFLRLCDLRLLLSRWDMRTRRARSRRRARGSWPRMRA